MTIRNGAINPLRNKYRPQHRKERNMKNNVVVFFGYQRFKCVGRKKHVTENDRMVWLLKMKSYCPDCGKTFYQTISKTSLINNGSLNRRCEECKQPGVGISTTRRKIFSA